jgi:hypothetical protein
MHPLIPIVVGGILYWIFKKDPPSDEKLAEEKRDLRNKMKKISLEQQKRASTQIGEE